MAEGLGQFACRVGHRPWQCTGGLPRQWARDYHGPAVIAGADLEAVLARHHQGPRIGGLDKAVHFPLPCRRCHLQQCLEQCRAKAAIAPRRQYHQGELGAAAFSHVLGMSCHRAISADCQQHHPVTSIGPGKAVQQRKIWGFAVGKVAFIESFPIHFGQKVG
jgi:hypothetical protein